MARETTRALQLEDLALESAEDSCVTLVDRDLLSRSPLVTSPLARAAKRTFDVLFASIFVLLLLPITPVIALAIIRSYGWPVLFKQERLGLSSRSFVIFKFRTLRGEVSFERPVGCTRLARYLRSTRLDELPNLLNVIRGDMSLIGPRPHPTYLENGLDSAIIGHDLRRLVRPGITGLSQVRGAMGTLNSIEEAKERLASDLEYIRSWSLRLDIEIALRTAVIMLRTIFAELGAARRQEEPDSEQ